VLLYGAGSLEYGAGAEELLYGSGPVELLGYTTALLEGYPDGPDELLG